MVVANRTHKTSYVCAANCARALLDIKKSGVIVIDDRDRILSEYRNHCCLSGQPGLGDSFVRWVHDNLGRRELVHLIPITPGDRDGDFQEFPRHEQLLDFDPSDKKFIAVANAHPDRPHILQAVDSKWWGWKGPLAKCGITIEFLCPDEIAVVAERILENRPTK